VTTEQEWLTGRVPALLRYAENLPGTGSKFRGDLGRKQILLACAVARLYWRYLDSRTRDGIATIEAEEERQPDEAERYHGVRPDPENFESWLNAAIQSVPSVIRNEMIGLWTLFVGPWQDFQYSLELVPARDQTSWQPLIHDVFGNPFRPVTFSPQWRTDTAVSLAQQMYEAREFSAMPILADALQDAGCDNDDILTHCRDPKQVHVRGCWVVDLVLGKE
jgi:hypothetical protein